jgi:hypothetical protein
MEEFPSVQRYLATLKTTGTKRRRLNHLNWLCILLKKTPDEIARTESDELRGEVRTLRNSLLEEHHDSRAIGIMIVSKMFYNAANDLHPGSRSFIRWRRDEIPEYVFKKSGFEYIPTMLEVWEMADALLSRPHTTPLTRRNGRLAKGSGMVWSSNLGKFLSLRNRALVLSFGMTGVRKNCIKRWTYGLLRPCIEGSCKHNHPNHLKMTGLPFYLKITTRLDTKLKEYKVPYYYTFLQGDGASALLEYISFRREQGWKPEDRSLIFVPNGPLGSQPMSDNAILHAIREAALLAPSTRPHARGIWPHQLRKTFRRVINAAPADDDFKTRVMGWRPIGSRKHYVDYWNPDEDALKYMTADFSRSGGQAFRSLVEKLEQQSLQIRKLQTELDEVRVRLATAAQKSPLTT